jgi:hypothetical protein
MMPIVEETMGNPIKIECGRAIKRRRKNPGHNLEREN